MSVKMTADQLREQLRATEAARASVAADLKTTRAHVDALEKRLRELQERWADLNAQLKYGRP